MNGLFNRSGSVTNRYNYTPWGQAQSTSEATYNPLRYASRELDPASELYYNRARWYDPYLGRFISEDPIGIDGGINVYAYAGNDPVNFTDPMGFAPCPAGYYGCGYTYGLPEIGGGGAGIGRNEQGFSRFLFRGLHGMSILGGMDWSPRHADSSEGPPVIPIADSQEGEDRRTCGQPISSAALSGGLDILTLHPVFAAYRGWQAAKNIPALLRSGNLSGRAAHDAAARKAQSEFRRTAASGAAGVSMGAAQTHAEGASWRYAVPIVGTGERIGDALITCLIEDWWLYV